MPSSSVRNTEQERDVHNYFLVSLARLHVADCSDLVQEVLHLFQKLLDMNADRLIECTVHTRDWHSEVRYSEKLNRPSNVAGAGNVMHELAWMLLKQYGRDAEAVGCFRLAAVCQDVALHIVREEERQQQQQQQQHRMRGADYS